MDGCSTCGGGTAFTVIDARRKVHPGSGQRQVAKASRRCHRGPMKMVVSAWQIQVRHMVAWPLQALAQLELQSCHPMRANRRLAASSVG